LLADRGEERPVADLHRQVGHPPTVGDDIAPQCDSEVGHGLLGLSGHIAAGDRVAVWVERTRLAVKTVLPGAVTAA
jgi:hypothetical protein